jgi:uncharacterized membrane protein
MGGRFGLDRYSRLGPPAFPVFLILAMATLFIGVLVSAFGLAYLIYGWKQAKSVAVIAGVLLCICPYLIGNWIWLGVVGGALLAAPFVIDI